MAGRATLKSNFQDRCLPSTRVPATPRACLLPSNRIALRPSVSPSSCGGHVPAHKQPFETYLVTRRHSLFSRFLRDVNLYIFFFSSVILLYRSYPLLILRLKNPRRKIILLPSNPLKLSELDSIDDPDSTPLL